METMQPEGVVDLIVAYETWMYEKQYKSAMEHLYSTPSVNPSAPKEPGQECDATSNASSSGGGVTTFKLKA